MFIFQGKLRQELAALLPQVCEGGALRAAPDVISHIYSGKHCFKGVGGTDLPSSRDVALTMGQVCCEFRAGQARFIFQGKVETRGWGASCPRFVRVVHSQQLLMWFGTFTPCSAASWGIVTFTCHLQGKYSLVWGRSPASLVEIRPSVEVATLGCFPGLQTPEKWVREDRVATCYFLAFKANNSPFQIWAGDIPREVPVKMVEITWRTSKQWDPEVNPKLDFLESGQSWDLGHPTRGKRVGQEFALLQATRRCQSHCRL